MLEELYVSKVLFYIECDLTIFYVDRRTTPRSENFCSVIDDQPSKRFASPHFQFNKQATPAILLHRCRFYNPRTSNTSLLPLPPRDARTALTPVPRKHNAQSQNGRGKLIPWIRVRPRTQSRWET